MAANSPEYQLAIVATFQDFAESHIALGAVRAAGIPAWLFDSHHVSTAPHLSIGLGVRLAVRVEDSAIAQQILEDAVRADGAELCPNCTSSNIRRKRRIWVAFLHFMAVGVPVSTPMNGRRRCHNCGHQWKTHSEQVH